MRDYFKYILKPNSIYIFVAGLSMLVIAFSVLGYLFNASQQELETSLLQKAGTTAMFTQGMIDQTASVIISAGEAPSIKAQHAEQANEYLKQLASNFSYIKAIAAADENGNVFATSNIMPNFNVADRPFFTEALEQGKVVVSDSIPDKLDNTIIFAVSKPLYDENHQFKGVVYALIPLNNLTHLISSIRLENQETILLLDSSDVPLIHPNQQLVKNQKPLRTYSELRENRNGQGIHVINRTANQAKILAYDIIPNTNWMVLVSVPRSTAVTFLSNKLTWPFVLFLLVSSPIFFLLLKFSITLAKKQNELVENNRTLEKLAVTDGLTDLYNHRFFQEMLEKHLKENPHNDPLALLLMDVDSFKHYNDAFGHQAGDMVLKTIASIIQSNCSKMDIAARYGGEEFVIILPGTNEADAYQKAEKIRTAVEAHRFDGEAEQPMGEITISVGLACYPTHGKTKQELIRAADQALYKAKFASMKNKVEVYHSVLDELKEDLTSSEQSLINTIKTLNTVIHAKDRYTYGHSERVMNYSLMIAKELGLDKETIRHIRYGAFLHDIGKIEIPGPVLNKPGTLADEEFTLIKQHPVLGAEIIKSLAPLKAAVPFVLYHHERYDGTGYPYGLRGDNIPLAARIGSVADSFDAMTTERPYKKAKNHLTATKELRAFSGRQFDPQIVKAFITALERNKRQVKMI